MGSWTGLSTSAYALGTVPLPHFARPDLADFGWTILLAAAVAVLGFAIMRSARALVPVLTSRTFLYLPVAGLVIAGLAILWFCEVSRGRAFLKLMMREIPAFSPSPTMLGPSSGLCPCFRAERGLLP